MCDSQEILGNGYTTTRSYDSQTGQINAVTKIRLYMITSHGLVGIDSSVKFCSRHSYRALNEVELGIVMSTLASQYDAINLGQGFPDGNGPAIFSTSRIRGCSPPR